MSSRASNSSSGESCEEYTRKRSIISSNLAQEEIEPYVRRKRSTSNSDKGSERAKKRIDNLNEEEQNLLRTCINSRERRRMHDLNDALDDLRRVIPHSENSNLRKMSKITTIILATNWIRQLTAEIEQLKIKIEQLGVVASIPSPAHVHVENNFSSTVKSTPASTANVGNGSGLLTTDFLSKNKKSSLINENFLLQQLGASPQKRMNVAGLPHALLHSHSHQHLNQQLPILPQFMAATFHNMAAANAFNANYANDGNKKLKPSLHLSQLALASAAAVSLINHSKNISPDFLLATKNGDGNNKILANVISNDGTSQLPIVAQDDTQETQSTVEDDCIPVAVKTKVSKTINTLENTRIEKLNDTTTICQRRHLLSPTSASASICLCVACILSSNASSRMTIATTTKDSKSSTGTLAMDGEFDEVGHDSMNNSNNDYENGNHFLLNNNNDLY